MAPPTGPRNPGPPNARAPRTSTGPSRGGGIRKRGASGPARIDRDGDLVMGQINGANGGGKHKAGLGAPRGRGGISTRGSRPRPAATAGEKIRRHLGVVDSVLASRVSESSHGRKFGSLANKKVFKITGLGESKAATNPDRGQRGAVEFLERKSVNLGRAIRIIKSHLDKASILYVLVHQDDAETLAKLNGFLFAGAKLTVAEHPEGWYQWNSDASTTKSQLSQEALERKRQLQAVLGNRYDPQAKLLNLSSLGSDPTLAAMGYLNDKETAEKTFKVLMAICDETFPTAEAKRDGVVSVSLANNQIDWVGQVFALADTFPALKHLDLSGNAFPHLKSLGRWRGRFRSLETLLLTGNPLETADPNYQAEVLDWFPRLQNLNGVQVRTPEQIAAAEAAKVPPRPTPIPQYGPDFRDTSGYAEAFLTQFITLYDSDRMQLLSQFYDDKSRFSLSVSTHSPRDQTDAPVLPWAAYIKYSRNLTKITNLGPRVQRLINGAAMIKQLWAVLPPTRHPDLKTEIHKYIVDCHPLPGLEDPTGQSPTGVDGLMITMHGEFEEIDKASGRTGKRSFTRVFILGPTVPGTPNPIRVVSDMLALRAHHPMVNVTRPAVSAEVEQKQQMIAELSRQTNMTPPYSEMCLTEVGWNFDLAIAKFNETRPNLGPEAFMNS